MNVEPGVEPDGDVLRHRLPPAQSSLPLDRVDWQRRRFSVLPGITCLWQLSGRSDIAFEEWMALDLQYIDQWSLRLDFTILVKTVGVVFRGRGAY